MGVHVDLPQPLKRGVVRLVRNGGRHIVFHFPRIWLSQLDLAENDNIGLAYAGYGPSHLLIAPAKHLKVGGYPLVRYKSGAGRAEIKMGFLFVKLLFEVPTRTTYIPSSIYIYRSARDIKAIALLWRGLASYLEKWQKSNLHAQKTFVQIPKWS